MQPEFWHERWAQNQIGFHEGAPNRLLVEHFARFGWASDSRLFVPLAGKSGDLLWLAAQGHRVVGIELDESAVRAFFDEADLAPAVAEAGALVRYASENIELYAGDIFDLDGLTLGAVDGVYDRAALIALPADMRRRYAAHIVALTGAAPQCLISLDYDQSQTDGPPFSVPGDDVRSLYGAHYRLDRLARADITGKLAMRCRGHEELWQLSPNAAAA